MDGIYFPGLGIFFNNVPSGITLFGINIKFYGMIIAAGFFIAYLTAVKEAKRTGQDPEIYLDYLLWLVVPAILGARIYYIVFNLKEFVAEGKSVGQTFLDMINIRNGGLAIYGGLIAGAIVAIVVAKKKGIPFTLLLDTITMGILIGQIMGRWGNFFNREVFGRYTDSVFRMAIPVDYYSKGFLTYLTDSGIVTDAMLKNQEIVQGVSCITVHPTFIYEGLWNLLLLIFIFIYRKKKHFDGELFTLYAFGYGVGRFLIEGMRTDSLMLGSFKISQLVAIFCIVVAIINMVIGLKRRRLFDPAKMNVAQSGEEQAATKSGGEKTTAVEPGGDSEASVAESGDK